ncbi:hypothetical protein HPP92_000005 [Vanilla planifolia]|uniref:Multiple myeloma tumor-associated protein 2-like N-terminal domain-containing protein n=1 Tax=Vanilla planifolia TaxID=51239 RepID=A0A835RZS7_VANPL|nr:hypothetical protein HPP92_000005 [Vanilla planifolia]
MYHPSRGGVRGGRDQFKWDDVKVDKHRENYVGHSIMAPFGRWPKGHYIVICSGEPANGGSNLKCCFYSDHNEKDLHWYVRDKNLLPSRARQPRRIRRIKKEQERQLMREALGLAPKRAPRPQENRLDKHLVY